MAFSPYSADQNAAQSPVANLEHFEGPHPLCQARVILHLDSLNMYEADHMMHLKTYNKVQHIKKK